MKHSKFCTFIGTPETCTRNEARDELFKVEGVYYDDVGTFTDYVVAFPKSEKTKKYQDAIKQKTGKKGIAYNINGKAVF